MIYTGSVYSSIKQDVNLSLAILPRRSHYNDTKCMFTTPTRLRSTRPLGLCSPFLKLDIICCQFHVGGDRDRWPSPYGSWISRSFSTRRRMPPVNTFYQISVILLKHYWSKCSKHFLKALFEPSNNETSEWNPLFLTSSSNKEGMAIFPSCPVALWQLR